MPQGIRKVVRRHPAHLMCWVVVVGWLVAGLSPRAAFGTDPLLLFVGEELSTLSVASRRPESPELAPAMVSVVTSHDIQTRGYRTLAEVLRHEAGFVIRAGERGSTPYLRGIREGILFLYDGVPLHLNVTKSVHPLDEELSLDGLERIEIVRGPGSVLWGADAYAGIVNLVPRRATSATPRHLHLEAGTERLLDAGCSLSGTWKSLRGLLSLSAKRDRFWDPTFSIETPDGGTQHRRIDDSSYYELTGSVQVGDWLSVTGRLADHTRRFSLQDTKGTSWPGEKRAPVRLIKLAVSKRMGLSDVQFNSFYQNVPFKLTDLDVERSQETDLWGAELLWHQPVASLGMVTLGAGTQRERTRNAVVRDGFLPELLRPEYSVFVPHIEQEDFENDLRSLFAQWRAPWGPVQWWVGARLDDPDAYESNVSVTAGVNWTPAQHWRIKATYGTAYRHPYAAQLFSDNPPPSEKIQTVALEAAWTHSQTDQVRTTFFYNRIHNHVQEDPLGGLSEAGDHGLAGMEVSANWMLGPRWSMNGFATVLLAGNDSVHYRVPSAVFLRPDGSSVTLYDDWSVPFDSGPDWTLGAGVQWHLTNALTLNVEGVWTGPYTYAFDKGETRGRYPGERNLRAHLRLEDLFLDGSLLEFTAENLLDQGGHLPGIFGPVERPPLRLQVRWSWSF